MGKKLSVLVIGDVVGQPGCRALFIGLGEIKKRTHSDFVVANGENAATGRGIRPEDIESLTKSGVDVITSGNHIWQKREIIPNLNSDQRILRPENYPTGVPGKGYGLYSVQGFTIGIANLQGRVQLPDVRDPFTVGGEIVKKLRKETNIIIIDMHAEFSEEKEALALYLDGRISGLIGTHTHVQTADEKILPGGTGYITDVGMTGPSESVIGMELEEAKRRSMTQMPLRLEVADGPVVINGVLLEIDMDSGKTLNIGRIVQPVGL